MPRKVSPPWKRPAPGKARGTRKLTPQQVAAARERAQQAGRRYPNLVDNMWAATLASEPSPGAATDTDTAPIAPVI